MPKSAKRAVSTATPVSASAKPGKASKRNVTVAGAAAIAKTATAELLATGTLAPAIGKSHTAALAAPVTDAAAPQPRGLTRDAAGIVAARTNFAQYSDRDSAYLHFFGAVCRANSGKATLRQIHDAGIKRTGAPERKRYNPHYAASGKATDVGAINRLISDGYFSRSTDGNTITATAKALANSIYLGRGQQPKA